LPGLSDCEAHWRLHFAHGVFLHTVAHSEVLACTSRGRCRLSDPEAVLRRIIDFCAAGLRQSA
ncbi:MAG: TetR/AcrR family transcriptional regulator, partial [Chthoniobacterales bacterium]